MNSVRPRSGVGRREVLAAFGLSALAGCSSASGLRDTTARVMALELGAPVHKPVWSNNKRALVALTEENSRIVRIDLADPGAGAPATARTTVSERFPEVGENLKTSPTGSDVVYLPQPGLDRVLLVSLKNLRPVGTLRAGPAPSFVANDSGSKFLLALSEDGSSVTGVNLHTSEAMPPTPVPASPEAELDGPKRGRLIDYHVTGPEGVLHYKGSPGAVEKKGELALSVEKSTGDLVKVSRLYVAERGTDRLLAVETKRSGHGLEVVAQAGFGEPVHHIGVDETRIYAATETKVIVLETNSFEGFTNDTFKVVETIDFRAALSDEALRTAPLSGLAVGPRRVHLTLEGEPCLVSVAKPMI